MIRSAFIYFILFIFVYRYIYFTFWLFLDSYSLFNAQLEIGLPISSFWLMPIQLMAALYHVWIDVERNPWPRKTGLICTRLKKNPSTSSIWFGYPIPKFIVHFSISTVLLVWLPPLNKSWTSFCSIYFYRFSNPLKKYRLISSVSQIRSGMTQTMSRLLQQRTIQNSLQ